MPHNYTQFKERDDGGAAVMDPAHLAKKHKLGVTSGVFIPVCLNILSILMFLRFGLILGQVGLLGILGLLVVAYLIDLVTTLSLSAVASNGEVKGGGAYYLISRSLGPEFGGSIGILFYLSQVLNTALNIVGLIDCLKLNFGNSMPHGYWKNYLLETVALVVCTLLCLAGSSAFAKASNALLVILTIAILSIPISALFSPPFQDPERGIEFTGLSLETLRVNLLPHTSGSEWHGLDTFRDLFGILFPATSGIFAGASMSGDLRNPSKSIPRGTLWAMLATFIAYILVIFSLAATTTHASLLLNKNIIQDTNLWAPTILAGECAVTFFSALMGIIAAAKLLQALARDRLLPGMSLLGKGTKKADEPIVAIFLTYLLAQLSLFANLNQIATFISMGYQMTFFVMNLACFLLKIGSAPNFRPGFKFFTWQTAFIGAVLSAAAMFFIDETYAASAVCLLVFLFLLIHYLSPPKHWGDVSQNLIYHQVRKYLLRLKPEHIKFWRPQIILLINDPRKQTRLIQFCNSMKKGALYILGHVIVTNDFDTGVEEAKLQQAAWTKYISEFSRIKAFVQLTISPTITWGVRNLILSAGLGGMRPNIAVLGFYNMEDLRESQPDLQVPLAPSSPNKVTRQASSSGKAPKRPGRRRGDTSARLMEGFLPTDVIRKEGMMSAAHYLTILEDLTLKFRLNVAVGKGFDTLQTPRSDEANTNKYIDLWPIQMSAELQAEGRSVLTTNFDTYTMILQLGYILHSVPAWKRAYNLRVLVFVEYENEVEAERGRVKALLDKLRIDAEVRVFWLASGQLSTYEAVIHGRYTDLEVALMVDECLKDADWWEDLKALRGRANSATDFEELASLANVVEATAGRPGIFNPHNGPEDYGERLRPSVPRLAELPKRPTVSTLARLGVNMGIHTQNLPRNVFDGNSDNDQPSEDGSDSDSSSTSMDADFDDWESAASDGDLDDLEPVRRPLLSTPGRRRSHSDVIIQKPTARRRLDVDRMAKSTDALVPDPYGTMSSKTLTPGNESSQELSGPSSSKSKSRSPGSPPRPTTPGDTAERGTASDPTFAASKAPRPARPPLSRQSSAAMRFSSNLVPETKIATNPEGTGPSIMFAETEQRRSRPIISRTNSTGRFSSRPIPETKVIVEGETGPTVSFAEPIAQSHPITPGPETGDESLGGGGDVEINIPELLEAYNQSQQRRGRGGGDAESASSCSSQGGLPLSFNDLPSRAQHLILNELMRQNSQDTAVLFTTLPIPEEGTCASEEASVRYLSDVEVLCHDLPPVLLVLSNSMTVTVSL